MLPVLAAANPFVAEEYEVVHVRIVLVPQRPYCRSLIGPILMEAELRYSIHMPVGSSIPRSNDEGYGFPSGYGAIAASLYLGARERKELVERTVGFCWLFISLLSRVVPFGGALLVIGSPIFGYGPYKQAIAVKGRLSHSRQQRDETQKHASKNKDSRRHGMGKPRFAFA